MSTNPEKNPFVRWRNEQSSRSLDKETENMVQRWVSVNRSLSRAFDLYDDEIEPWIENKTTKAPDLVEYVALYGYTRIASGNWTELPILVSDDAAEDWRRNSGLFATIGQLREDQAGIAGCLPLMLHADLPRVMRTLNEQLEAHYAELRQLAAKPVGDFTPTQWPEEAIGDEVIDIEGKKLRRIFELYEKLYCFELGIEEIRVFMITEDAPEVHLPSVEFYDALVSISSHRLLTTLDAAEPKMRAILKLWSETTMEYTGEPYYRERETAPDSFWWRHFKLKGRRSQPQRQSSNSRPPRTSR